MSWVLINELFITFFLPKLVVETDLCCLSICSYLSTFIVLIGSFVFICLSIYLLMFVS